MTAYVIFQETIHDHPQFEAYKKISPKSIEKFGGKFIARGGPIHALEGEFNQERVVIISFPDRATAIAWHQSSDYADAKQLRQDASSAVAIIVDGI